MRIIPAWRLGPLLALAWTLVLLCGCTEKESPVHQADAARLRVEVRDLKKEQESLEAEMEAAKEEAAEAKAGLGELEAMKKELLELKKEREKRESEFLEYRKKYQAKALKGLEGREFESLTFPNGKTLERVKIASANRLQVRLMHSAGGMSVDLRDLPSEIIEELQFDPEEDAAFSSRIADYATAVVEATPKEEDDDSNNRFASVSPRERKSSRDSHRDETKTSSAVVIIEAGDSAGSGFVAEIEGKQYLYTNAHVVMLSGKITVKFVDGEVITGLNALQASKSHDLVRFPLSGQVAKNPLRLTATDQDVELQTTVAAFGNSGGAGVITREKGSVLGLGPKELELDIAVAPGNSGGPVVLAGTNEVVAVVTYAIRLGDPWNQGTRYNKIRRFGLRPERIDDWQSTSLTNVQRAWKKIHQINLDTISMALMTTCQPTTTGLRAPGGAAHNGFRYEEWFRDSNPGTTGFGSVFLRATGKLNSRVGPRSSRNAILAAYGEFFKTVERAYTWGLSDLNPAGLSWAQRQYYEGAKESRQNVSTDLKSWRNAIADGIHGL